MQFSFREPSHIPLTEYRYSSKIPEDEDATEAYLRKIDGNQILVKNINFGNEQAMKKKGDEDPWSDYSPEHDSLSIFVETNSPNFSPSALNNEKSDRENFTFSKKAPNTNAYERQHIKIDLTSTSPERKGSHKALHRNENIESLSFAGKRSDVFSSRNEEGFLKEKFKISELLLSPNMFDDLKTEENNANKAAKNYSESLDYFSSQASVQQALKPFRSDEPGDDDQAGDAGESEGEANEEPANECGAEEGEGMIEDENQYFEEQYAGYQRTGDGRKSSERRDFNEFLRNQKEFERKKEEKRKQLLELRESKLQNLFSHQPTINKKSILITSQKHLPPQPIHQRLFLQSKKQIALNNAKFAKKDKRSCLDEGSQKNNSKATPRTTEIHFVRKFIKDFQKVVMKIPCLKNGKTLETILDYVICEEILKKLGFLRDSCASSIGSSNNGRSKQDLNRRSNSNIEQESKTLMNKIYEALGGELSGGIKKRNLIKFLLCLMGVDLEVTNTEIAREEEAMNEDNKENGCKQEDPRQSSKFGRGADIMATKDDARNEFVLRNPGNAGKHQHHASCINLSTFSSFDFFNTHNNLARTTKFRDSNVDRQVIGRFDENGHWDIRKEEVKDLHKLFEVLKRNRLTTESLKKTKKNWNEYDFKPKVSEVSKQLAAHHRQKLAQDTLYLIENNNVPLGTTFSKDAAANERAILFTDLLVLQKNFEKLKHQKIYEEKQRQELNKYSFQPGLNSSKIVYSKSTHDLRNKRSNSMTQERLNFLAAPKHKKDRAQVEVEFEKSQVECTFAPDLSSTRNRKIFPMTKEIITRDLGDALCRLRSQKRQEEEPENNKKYEWNEETEANEHGTRDEHGNQPEDGTNENAIQLLIDINIGNGVVKRIGINKFSAVSEVAERFAHENNLDENVKNRLTQLLDVQLQQIMNPS